MTYGWSFDRRGLGRESRSTPEKDAKRKIAVHKGSAAMKAKAREKQIKDALTVDFSKPYGKGA